MKIKKTYQGSLPENRILNTHSSSQTDTYSCDYINDSSVVVSAVEPTTDRKKIWVQKGKNLFDKNAVLKGYEINGGDGTTTANEGWFVSDYIAVNNLSNITISSSGKTVGNSNCFYDKNKSFISTISAITGTIAIPTNACYMRFNGRLSEIDNDIQIEQGSTATTYEAYIDNKIYIKNNNDVYEEFVQKNATITENGLMSSNDKIKLNNLAPTERLITPDLNNLDGNYMTYCLNTINAPIGHYYGFLIQMHINPYPYKKQLWSSFDKEGWYKRTCNNGTWTSWTTF